MLGRAMATGCLRTRPFEAPLQLMLAQEPSLESGASRERSSVGMTGSGALNGSIIGSSEG